MSGATMVVGLSLIIGYWLDLTAESSLIVVLTRLACPVMLMVMPARFTLYSSPHGHAHAK